MSSALEAAWSKYQRAWADFNALEVDIQRFLAREPYKVDVRFERESGWHIAYVRLVEEPPAALSVLVGSIAYQCYSALNHVVWKLVVRKIGQKRADADRRRIDFPIAKGPADFRGLYTVRNVSKPARAVLESLQPYHGHNPTLRAHPLMLMKELANADKHRVLAPSYGLGQFSDILSGVAFEWDEAVASDPTFRRDLPVHQKPFAIPVRALKDGTELARVRFEVGNERANVRVSGQPLTEIVFESDSWGFMQARLGDVMATTAHCLKQLATLFAREPWPPTDPDGG